MTAAERHANLTRLATEDDARINATRIAAGLPPFRSVVLTAEQCKALHAGSLTLAEILGDSVEEAFGLPPMPREDVTAWICPR